LQGSNSHNEPTVMQIENIVPYIGRMPQTLKGLRPQQNSTPRAINLTS